eukprot:2035286-Pleurochrysis_carterae.AAC.1
MSASETRPASASSGGGAIGNADAAPPVPMSALGLRLYTTHDTHARTHARAHAHAHARTLTWTRRHMAPEKQRVGGKTLDGERLRLLALKCGTLNSFVLKTVPVRALLAVSRSGLNKQEQTAVRCSKTAEQENTAVLRRRSESTPGRRPCGKETRCGGDGKRRRAPPHCAIKLREADSCKNA